MVTDLRGSAEGTAPANVLEDPTGRRRRVLGACGRGVALLATLWLLVLALGGIGVLPTAGLPLGRALRPSLGPPTIVRRALPATATARAPTPLARPVVPTLSAVVRRAPAVVRTGHGRVVVVPRRVAGGAPLGSALVTAGVPHPGSGATSATPTGTAAVPVTDAPMTTSGTPAPTASTTTTAPASGRPAQPGAQSASQSAPAATTTTTTTTTTPPTSPGQSGSAPGRATTTPSGNGNGGSSGAHTPPPHGA